MLVTFKTEGDKGETFLDLEVTLSNYTLFRTELFSVLDMIVNKYVTVMKDEKLLTKFLQDLFREIEKIVYKVKPVHAKDLKSGFSEKLPVDLGKASHSLYKITLNDINHLKDLMEFTIRDKDTAGSLTDYIIDTIKLADIDSLRKISGTIPIMDNSESNEYNKELIKNVQNDQTTYEEMFRLLDASFDGNGSIGLLEFEVLTRRLGIVLTQHRIREIFTDIKHRPEEDLEREALLELDVKDFRLAVDRLKMRQVEFALVTIGVTPAVLYGTLAYLLILLLLLFSFIFLGIRAFAVGGAFSAVINSILPGIGALSVGSRDEGEEKVATDKIRIACKQTMDSLSAHHT